MTGKANTAQWAFQGLYTIGSLFATMREAFAAHYLGAAGWGFHAAVGSVWLTLYALHRRPKVEIPKGDA